jgi:hypothetical protein
MDISSLTPPYHLVTDWMTHWYDDNQTDDTQEMYIANKAAMWGAIWGATNALEIALKDTAPVHWRVAGGAEDGMQIVRVADLMEWLATFRKECEAKL